MKPVERSIFKSNRTARRCWEWANSQLGEGALPQQIECVDCSTSFEYFHSQPSTRDRPLGVPPLDHAMIAEKMTATPLIT